MGKFYHITDTFANWVSIGKTGIKADEEGYIYFITDKKVAGYIAQFQLGFEENFGLIEINPKGIEVEIEEDNVGELTAKYQRRIKQDLIKPQFVRLEDMYHLPPLKIIPWLKDGEIVEWKKGGSGKEME